MSEPITTALRGLLCAKPKGDPCWDAMDAVDAVHAALEAENAELRAKLDNAGGSMHDGGRITGELRKYGYGFCGSSYEVVNAIADRIDAEHESACKRERGEGIRIAEESALEEMGQEYVKLPVDADGVPIRVGDVVVENGCGVPYKVMSLKLFEDCWDVGECGMNPNLCRHHTPDSWERIIEDACKRAVDGYPDKRGCIAMTNLVARCKALAGDAE